jgi:hypothetical protein
MRAPGASGDSAAWVGQSLLPFGNDEARLFSNLDDLHEKLALAMNLRRLEPCAHGLPVAQRSALRLVGDIGLTAVVSTPTAALVDDHHEAVVAFLHHGRIDYRIGGHHFQAEAGRTAVYLPGEAMKVRTRHHIGIAYNLNPSLLARYLQEQDPALSLERALLALQRPWQINLADPASLAGQQHLQLIVRLLDGTAGIHPSATILSLLQERLYQATAQMLLPALRRG